MPIATTHRRLLLPSAALLLGYAAVNVNSQQCTLCEDGSPIDPNGMIGSTPCADIDSVIGATPVNSTTCVDAQLQGYLNCGCPTYPGVYCAMCAEGGTDITDRQKIAFTNQTCADVLFVKEAELDSCADITQYESLCGCPDAPAAPATCSLCGEGEELTNQSTVVGDFETTCQDVFDYAPFVTTAEECDGNILPLAGMCCLAPGETRPPTLAPTLAPTSSPSISPSVSDATSEPTSAPSAATSTTASSWRWMATVALSAVVAAFL
jgi:hypothetical protein